MRNVPPPPYRHAPMKIPRIFPARVCTRAGRNVRACTYAVSAACYTEVLYRLTVGNRRERRRKACQGLRRGFGFPILLIFLFLPPFRFLALPFCLSLSRRPTPGGCLPLLPLVSLPPSSLPPRPSSRPRRRALSAQRALSAAPLRPAIYASVESVRCCGQLPRFKENQELRPGERERERETLDLSARSSARFLLSPVHLPVSRRSRLR